ncbi:hypothetical protein J1614_011559 [Plenodomus biglobosus]|nr:hypothetical protein J1614_011559 [Plenodomus biglobosus]
MSSSRLRLVRVFWAILSALTRSTGGTCHWQEQTSPKVERLMLHNVAGVFNDQVYQITLASSQHAIDVSSFDTFSHPTNVTRTSASILADQSYHRPCIGDHDPHFDLP